MSVKVDVTLTIRIARPVAELLKLIESNPAEWVESNIADWLRAELDSMTASQVLTKLADVGPEIKQFLNDC